MLQEVCVADLATWEGWVKTAYDLAVFTIPLLAIVGGLAVTNYAKIRQQAKDHGLLKQEVVKVQNQLDGGQDAKIWSASVAAVHAVLDANRDRAGDAGTGGATGDGGKGPIASRADLGAVADPRSADQSDTSTGDNPASTPGQH